MSPDESAAPQPPRRRPAGRWSGRRSDGLIAGNPRLVEIFLTVGLLASVGVIGLFLVLALELAAWGGGRPAAEGLWRWAPALLLLVTIGGGGLMASRGYRRGGRMAPWALAGAVCWIAGTLWLLTR